MKICVFLAAVCVSIQGVLSAGAGRAIPIDTENFVEELFQTVNRRIKYDATNFLVDLAGNYANCDFIGIKAMSVAERRTPEGVSIGIIQDFTSGDQTHTRAVDKYLQPVFDSWVSRSDFRNSEFRAQIANADRFGCSVRPGCRGQVSVACLFSPAGLRFNDVPPRRTTTTTPKPRTRPPPPLRGEQKAKAFTPQQYDMAEFITGQKWDRAHYLENLSGYETVCKMVIEKTWKFPYATSEARARGKEIIGLYGYAINENSTPKALDVILKNMKRIRSKQVGCSLIPDCFVAADPKMYVVVSCVFEI